jgi:predicted Zn-dependent protease
MVFRSSLVMLMVLSSVTTCFAQNSSSSDAHPTFVTQSPDALLAYKRANALFNEGKIESCAAECMRALKLDPSFSPCIARLADCYYVRGQYKFAKQCYRDFLIKAPFSRSAEHCRERIVLCDKDEHNARQSFANSSNYVNEVQSNWAKCIWSETKLPLKVYIDPWYGAGGREYAVVFREALDEWMKVLDHRLTYKFVNSPFEANIICQWTMNCSDPNHQGETGLRYSDLHNGTANLERAAITIAVNSPQGPVSNQVMKSTCLHEIGHALGLHGHSTNKNDIMYFAVSKFALSRLTPRDVNTINYLYSNYTKHY